MDFEAPLWISQSHKVQCKLLDMNLSTISTLTFFGSDFLLVGQPLIVLTKDCEEIIQLARKRELR